jgi:hypothetical protein
MFEERHKPRKSEQSQHAAVAIQQECHYLQLAILCIFNKHIMIFPQDSF